jgi:hypothetical protein
MAEVEASMTSASCEGISLYDLTRSILKKNQNQRDYGSNRGCNVRDIGREWFGR